MSLWMVSFLLVLWCDAALVIDAWKLKRAPKVMEHRSAGVGDWLLWLAAVGFSAWSLRDCVLGVLSYHGNGNLVILLMPLPWITFVIVFDAAVVADAVKMWRARRTGQNTDT